jgi:hypothetical protein
VIYLRIGECFCEKQKYPQIDSILIYPKSTEISSSAKNRGESMGKHTAIID